MLRLENQCPDCICFGANWDEDVEETMAEQAPGEECSNGMEQFMNKPCPCFQQVEVQNEA